MLDNTSSKVEKRKTKICSSETPVLMSNDKSRCGGGW